MNIYVCMAYEYRSVSSISKCWIRFDGTERLAFWGEKGLSRQKLFSKLLSQHPRYGPASNHLHPLAVLLLPPLRHFIGEYHVMTFG